MTNFGKTIYELIESKGITQRYLANKIGTTEATISRYINQKKTPTSIDFLCKMSKALNVSTDYLLGLTPSTEDCRELSADEKIILACFKRANEDDTDVIWATLRKYMTPNERRYYQQLKESEDQKIG